MLQTLMVRGHFDGEAIRLDEPLAMAADTQVIVTVIAPQSIESDDELWARLARLNLKRAYGVEEPDYSMAMLKEPNPSYEAGCCGAVPLTASRRCAETPSYHCPG